MSRSKPRTRSAQHEHQTQTGSSKVQENDIRLVVAPERISNEASFIPLQLCTTSQPELYLYCPKNGFYELTTVSKPPKSPSSILLVAQRNDESAASLERAGKEGRDRIVKNANLLVATTLNPIWILMPLFETCVTDKGELVQLARTEEDVFDVLFNASPHLEVLMKRTELRTALCDSLQKYSEVVSNEEGELAYQPRLDLLLQKVVSSAKRAVNDSWPKSLEEYAQKMIDLPLVRIGVTSEVREDSQTSESTGMKDEILKLARVQTACDYMLSNYVPKKLHKTLRERLGSSELVDFSPLQARLKLVEEKKAEVSALQTLSDNVSRKRAGNELDDEAQEERAEKRRKKEAEVQKAKIESRATKDLKKADLSGMKKLSSFFTKKAVG